MLPLMPLLLALTPQQTQIAADVELPGCTLTRCWGKRIAHTVGMFRFCVPYSMKYWRAVDAEGDTNDTITIQSHGENGKLIIFPTLNPGWGPVKARPEWFPSSDPSPEGSVRRWRCSEGDGWNFRRTQNGRYWRMLAFPLGHAKYQDVSANIARKFDRLLDSLCCEPIRQ